MIKSIQVYTAGCPRSVVTAAFLEQAVKEMGIDVEVENIDEPDVRREHGVAVTPSIRINGDIKIEGRMCDIECCKKFLTEYL